MKTPLLFILAIFAIPVTYSQTIDNRLDSLLTETGLPVLYMTTDSGEEPKGNAVYPPSGAWGVGLTGNEYQTGELTIKLDGNIIYSSGAYKKGTGGARIKLRGNTSAIGNGKKPYKIKLSKKSDLLFRGYSFFQCKEWVLLPAHDTKLVKFITGIAVAECVGMEWEPDYEVVSLVLNGDYKGMYLLVDAIEKGPSRCNVDYTGFIIEDDAYWWNEEKYFKGNILPYPVGFTFKYPDNEDVTDELLENIKQYMLEFEELLVSKGNVGSMIDMGSFASWLLAHDILGTGDSGGTNRYLYKYDFTSPTAKTTNSSLLKMGPLWDFDAVFKNEGRWASIHNVDYSFYFPYLLDIDEFKNEYLKVWNEMSPELYSIIMSELNTVLKEKGNRIDLCKELDYARWYQPNNEFKDDVALVDDWLTRRMEWLNENINEEYATIKEIENDGDETFDGIYSIWGTEVERILLPGIYIVNGRKVMVK